MKCHAKNKDTCVFIETNEVTHVLVTKDLGSYCIFHITFPPQCFNRSTILEINSPVT